MIRILKFAITVHKFGWWKNSTLVSMLNVQNSETLLHSNILQGKYLSGSRDIEYQQAHLHFNMGVVYALRFLAVKQKMCPSDVLWLNAYNSGDKTVRFVHAEFNTCSQDSWRRSVAHIIAQLGKKHNGVSYYNIIYISLFQAIFLYSHAIYFTVNTGQGMLCDLMATVCNLVWIYL